VSQTPPPRPRAVLVTNVLEFAGPGAVAALRAAGMNVVCHDRRFADAASRGDYLARHPGVLVVEAQAPADIVGEAIALAGELDAVVSNDVCPNSPAPVEEISLDDLRATIEAVLVTPAALVQPVVRHMKPRRSGSLVFVTSARELRPEPGFSVATAARAGATAFSLAVARELAPAGIQVNAVAPNYLESEAYYPRARFVDDPAGRQQIEQAVPFGRLGRQDEIGALIAFLASGTAPFVTGQVISFTGGWP
jgi:3-oxoacyl-[acyl-carrier protein] reductase